MPHWTLLGALTRLIGLIAAFALHFGGPVAKAMVATR